MMTSPETLTGGRRGRETQAFLELQKRKITPNDFFAIGVNEFLADDVAEVIIRHCLFIPPEEQIKKLLEINDALWRDPAITAESIASLGEPPVSPVSDENRLYCVTLFYDTGDVVETFRRNWEACVHVHSQDGTWKWDGLLFTTEGVRQRAGALPRPKGLRWQVCELGRAYQEQSVKNVRPQLDSGQIMGMGQEGPMIASLHSKWAVSMNGESIPYMDMPDLEVAPIGQGGFSYAPALFFHDGARQVGLVAGGVSFVSPRFGSGSLR